MEKIEITSISSRGQVVIPQNIRDRLGIKEGEKFIVLGQGNTVILKKVESPSFKDFEELIKKTRKFSKDNNLNERDMEEAIKKARAK